MENRITENTVLFFDLDGTLVDTDYANFLSYKKAIQLVTQYACRLTFDPHARFTRSELKRIFPTLAENEYDKIVAEKEKCYSEFLPKTKLNGEISGILYRYFKTNKTVLVTNCREARALEILNYHGLTDKFSNLFFRQFSEDNTKINKFKNAISCLDISPKLVIAFENEEIEIVDAKTAGIQIVNSINI
jgi:FMN phosphatase YigB (HAD superfamily)